MTGAVSDRSGAVTAIVATLPFAETNTPTSQVHPGVPTLDHTPPNALGFNVYDACTLSMQVLKLDPKP